MIDGVFLQILSLLYILALSFVYFKKEKVKTVENKIFSKIVICNIFGLLVHISLYVLITNIGIESFITIFVSKIYLIYLISYMIFFTLYDLIISIKNKDLAIKKYNLYNILSVIIIIFISILIFNLSESFVNEPGKIYTYGPAINFVYIFSFIIVFLNILLLVLHIKDIFSKKYYPLFLYIFLGFVTMIIQYKYPYMQLMTAKDSFIILLMYFTIENPDVKMLEEYHKAKEIADNSNNEKAMFLLNISEAIRKPAGEIKELASKGIDSENKDDYLRAITVNSEQILSSVNSALDISTIESHDLKIVNTKYNPKALFKQLTVSFNEELGDRNIDFQVSIDDSIPEYLYGDSIRLKEIIKTLLGNSSKYTKKGFIALTVKYIVKNNVCRLLITLEDSGVGIESDKLNKIFNQEEYNQDKSNLTKVKSLINLIGGTMVVNSESGNGTKFTIVLDQKLFVSDKKAALEQFDDKYMNNSKILVIDYNYNNCKDIKKYLKHNDIEIDYVDNSEEGLEKIRNNEKYILILIKEDMPKLNSDAVIFKLNEIKGFKIPYVVMVNNAKNTKYREYLVTPVKRNLLLDIIDKYI